MGKEKLKNLKNFLEEVKENLSRDEYCYLSSLQEDEVELVDGDLFVWNPHRTVRGIHNPNGWTLWWEGWEE